MIIAPTEFGLMGVTMGMMDKRVRLRYIEHKLYISPKLFKFIFKVLSLIEVIYYSKLNYFKLKLMKKLYF